MGRRSESTSRAGRYLGQERKWLIVQSDAGLWIRRIRANARLDSNALRLAVDWSSNIYLSEMKQTRRVTTKCSGSREKFRVIAFNLELLNGRLIYAQGFCSGPGAATARDGQKITKVVPIEHLPTRIFAKPTRRLAAPVSRHLMLLAPASAEGGTVQIFG
jgi:hypothetical protein